MLNDTAYQQAFNVRIFLAFRFENDFFFHIPLTSQNVGRNFEIFKL